MKIVCELGLNTNGSLERALQMVEAAKEAGADGVKVQAYHTKDFLPEGHPDWDLFEDNRLDWIDIFSLRLATRDLGLLFGGTPTSIEGIRMLQNIGADFLKNGSDFLLRHDLIHAMLDTGIRTWASIGMATNEEIGALPLGNLNLGKKLFLMACTSLYPCPSEHANIARVMPLDVDGYSDHTRSLLTAALCVAQGASMYETHFTLNHNLPGPDHAWSRDPEELKVIVQRVREAEILLGSHNAEPSSEEFANRDKWRVTEGQLRS